MLLLFLVVLLILILIVNYQVHNHEILTPSFIYTASFCLSTIWALLYAQKWNLNLHLNTFLVLFLGALEFSVIAYLCSILYPSSWLKSPITDTESPHYEIRTWKIVCVVVFEILVILITLKTVRSIIPGGSLSQAIYSYRSQVIDPVKSLRLKPFPEYVVLSRAFSDAIGYFFSYLTAKGLIISKKVYIKYLLPFILSIVNSMLLGSRGGTIMLLIAALVYVYSLYMKKNEWHTRGNAKVIVIAVAIFIVVAFSFQSLASLLGRNVSQFSGMDYMAIYLGAEVKNLDTYLQTIIFPIHRGIIGGQTFINLNSTFSKIFGLSNLKYSLNLPFLSVNGYSLGNVYTSYYSYINDLGYFGVSILVGLMSVISQFSFDTMNRSLRVPQNRYSD